MSNRQLSEHKRVRYKMALILLQPQEPSRHRASWQTLSLEFTTFQEALK